jgi:hypothetical protein
MLPPHPHRYDRLLYTIDGLGHPPEPPRNVRRRLVAALRGLTRAIARATSALLAAAGAEAVLLMGSDSTCVLRCERPRLCAPAPLARIIQPPDLHAVIGEVLYPGRPGAVVRFTEAMVGTDLMVNYPWSREHGWAARN